MLDLFFSNQGPDYKAHADHLDFWSGLNFSQEKGDNALARGDNQNFPPNLNWSPSRQEIATQNHFQKEISLCDKWEVLEISRSFF